jgi:hypothetical protein
MIKVFQSLTKTLIESYFNKSKTSYIKIKLNQLEWLEIKVTLLEFLKMKISNKEEKLPQRVKIRLKKRRKNKLPKNLKFLLLQKIKQQILY